MKFATRKAANFYSESMRLASMFTRKTISRTVYSTAFVAVGLHTSIITNYYS